MTESSRKNPFVKDENTKKIVIDRDIEHKHNHIYPFYQNIYPF